MLLIPKDKAFFQLLGFYQVTPTWLKPFAVNLWHETALNGLFPSVLHTSKTVCSEVTT